MISEKKIFSGFPHYNPMGAIRCHGNQSSDPIWSKTLCILSPLLNDASDKFHSNRPSGCRDIHV